MKRSVLKTLVPILITLAILFALFRTGVSYRPPLLSGGEKTAFESAVDFFAFGWHYSREAWFRQSRNWMGAQRARLLAFRHRPDYPAYSEFREQSLFQLGRLYQMADLPGPAAEFYLQARLQEPENRWLENRVGDKLADLKQWDRLETYSREILTGEPEHVRARVWLETARAARDGGN